MCESFCTIVCLCELDEIISLLLCPARGYPCGITSCALDGVTGKDCVCANLSVCVSLCTIVCLCELDEIISLLLCPARGYPCGITSCALDGVTGKY